MATNWNETLDLIPPKPDELGLTEPTYEDINLAGPTEEIKDLGNKVGEIGGGTDYISNEALVDTQLGRILSEENPYVQAAQKAAMKQMNRRGMLSSTLAQRAGTQSALEAALPIATQNAQQIAQADLAKQGYDITSNLNKQGYLQNLGQMNYEGNLNASQGLFGYNAGMNEAYYNALNKGWLSDLEFQQAKKLQDQANEFKYKLDKLSLDTNTRNAILGQASDTTQRYLSAYTSLLQDPNLTPEARKASIEQLNAEYEKQLSSLLSLGAGTLESIGGVSNITTPTNITSPTQPIQTGTLPTQQPTPTQEQQPTPSYGNLQPGAYNTDTVDLMNIYIPETTSNISDFQKARISNNIYNAIKGITNNAYTYTLSGENTSNPKFQVVNSSGNTIPGLYFDTKVVQDNLNRQYAVPNIIQRNGQSVWPVLSENGEIAGYVRVQ